MTAIIYLLLSRRSKSYEPNQFRILTYVIRRTKPGGIGYWVLQYSVFTNDCPFFFLRYNCPYRRIPGHNDKKTAQKIGKRQANSSKNSSRFAPFGATKCNIFAIFNVQKKALLEDDKKSLAFGTKEHI